MRADKRAQVVYYEKDLNIYPEIDELDFKIINLLISGYSNKEISEKVKIPLSTVQKRTRKIIRKGLITIRKEPDYKKLGFKTAFIHIYVANDNIYSIAEKFSKMDGVQSVSLHTGNSDILGFFLYKNTKQLMGLVSEIKGIEGIQRIAWSEEVYVIPSSKDNLLSVHSELK